MAPDRRRGLTLFELVVAMFLLSFVIMLVFGIFSLATRTFNHTLMRQGLETDARRFSTVITRDANQTHFSTVSMIARTAIVDGVTVRRDAIAFALVSDWDALGAFDPSTGLPVWNRYIVYYATLDQEGRLVRQVVDPSLSGGSVGVFPYGALGANLSDAPETNADVETTSVLSSNVFDFQVELQPADQIILVGIRFRAQSARSAGERADESFQADFWLDPKNTWPEL